MKLKIPSLPLLSFLFFASPILFVTSEAGGETRTWTSGDGREIEGTLLSYDGWTVTLRVHGRDFEILPERLVEADRAFLDEWLAERQPLFREWTSTGGGQFRGEAFFSMAARSESGDATTKFLSQLINSPNRIAESSAKIV